MDRPMVKRVPVQGSLSAKGFFTVARSDMHGMTAGPDPSLCFSLQVKRCRFRATRQRTTRLRAWVWASAALVHMEYLLRRLHKESPVMSWHV